MCIGRFVEIGTVYRFLCGISIENKEEYVKTFSWLLEVITAKVKEEKNVILTDDATSVMGTVSEGENKILSAMDLKENAFEFIKWIGVV